MKKEFSAEEVAKAVLNRCKEIADQNKIEKKEEVEKCDDMEKSSHEKEMDKCGDMNKSNKLKEWMKKKKKTDLKKMFGRTATSAQGGGSTPPPAPAPGTSIADQIGFGKDEAGASKAMGLKPLASEKIKPPAADQMPEKPKAATTLKSYMAKRKKNG